VWGTTLVGWLRGGRLRLVLRIVWWLLKNGHRPNLRLDASLGPVSSLSAANELLPKTGRREGLKVRSTYLVRRARWICAWETSGASAQKRSGAGLAPVGNERAVGGEETLGGLALPAPTLKSGIISSS